MFNSYVKLPEDIFQLVSFLVGIYFQVVVHVPGQLFFFAGETPTTP